MKINEYKVVSTAVEEGVAYALSRGLKYVEATKSQRIFYDSIKQNLQSSLESAVMSCICEVVDFDTFEIQPPEAETPAITETN